MKNASPYFRTYRTRTAATAIAIVLAVVLTPAVLRAQDAPSAPAQPAAVAQQGGFENEFEAQRAASGQPAPAADATTSTTVTTTTTAAPATDAPAPATTATPAATETTTTTTSTTTTTVDPIAQLTESKAEGEDVLITNQPDAGLDATAAAAAEQEATQELSPVVEASGETPPDMPSETAAPEMPGGDAAAATAPAPADADPLAQFRQQKEQAAQQAIQNAERARANPAGNTNPLGPAATLPLGNANMQSPEELQAQLEAEAATQKERMEQQIFDASLESLLPLTPEQTRSVLDSFRDSREAAETPIAVPKARTTVENVSLDPSQPPLSIKTSPGYVTTLTILDVTGAPWAIQDLSWAGKFEVTTPEEGGHVIRITPMSAHGVGNISIRLVDLITPITFSIDTGLDVVDYRFDARIPKTGPLAKTPLIANGGLTTVAGNDENLMRVLDGTSVGAATRLTLDGVDGATSAYSIDDTMYLRTPLTLLSPAWQSSATSADGMNVYTLKATPIILLSDKGRMVKARLKAQE